MLGFKTPAWIRFVSQNIVVYLVKMLDRSNVELLILLLSKLYILFL